jgi:long-chain acyl-CoA synthetase
MDATVHDAPPAVRQDGAPGDLLGALAHWARVKPASLACVDNRSRWNWDIFYTAVRKAAAALRHRVVGAGDADLAQPVGVLMDNSAEFAIAACAVMAAGAPFELFPADLPAATRAQLVWRSGVRMMIRDATHADETWPGVSGLSLEQLWDDEDSERPFAAAPGNGDATGSVIYSSGTTGVPKAIAHSRTARAAVNQAAKGLGLDSTAVNLVSLPMFNNLALVTWLPTLVNGGCNVILERFGAQPFCEAVQLHRATHFVLSPRQYRELLAFDRLEAFRLDSLQLHISSSSRLAAAEKAAIIRRLPGQFCEIYGVTEGGVGTLLRAQEGAKLHTVGKPMAMYEMTVIDDAGRELPAGAVGYIAGHSAFMMSGYRGAVATPRYWDCASRPGRRFFVPGDLGYFDADGYLVVLDRDTDTRWLEGERWFPSAMEAELLEHTRCAELAVSLQRETGPGPWPLQVDWVGSEADEEALRNALRLHYPQFQASLARRERLPRNGMGKLLRPQLTPESQHA